MSLYGMFTRPGASGFGYTSTAEQVSEGLDLSGRRYLVTGCNSGLGLETVRVLALRGATVLGAARTAEKASEALSGIVGTTIPLACELGDPGSVRRCVGGLLEQGHLLHGIITNAGIMALPKRQESYGYEQQFFVNHVGHFMLVTGILNLLALDGRVVSLSSSAHTMAPAEGIELDNLSGERGYAPWRAYGQSKLANLLFARELSRRFQGTQKVACAVHPGVIATNLGRHMGLGAAALALAGPLFLKTIPQGAATQVWAAVKAEPDTIRGQFLADCNVATSSKAGQDTALAERLWQKTEEIVASLPA